MAKFMTLHASAYPPAHWTFLPSSQHQSPRISSNRLWTEMTEEYDRSMAHRHRLASMNLLSKTATKDNVRMMQPDTETRYREEVDVDFEDSSDSRNVLRNARWFIKTLDKLSQKPMKTIPEEDIFEASDNLRQPNQTELLQLRQAIKTTREYEQLQGSDEIEDSFRTRLNEIYSICHDFICTPVGKHPRPRWAQIVRAHEEVTAHVAHVQQQLTSDVVGLKEFLRGQLFDEYCLMRGTPMEKKIDLWLEFGECIMLGDANSDPQVQGRLERMIEYAGLDPQWVKDRLEDYYDGDEHIGRWQRYAQGRRWTQLAAKLSMDIRQLEIINSTRSSNGRRCKIMSNMLNTKRQFFKTLNGTLDYELSDKALRTEEEEEYESSSASSSTTSLVAVS